MLTIALIILLALAMGIIVALLFDRREKKAMIDNAVDMIVKLNKTQAGLRLTLRTRTSRFDKRIAQLQRELREEQENSLRLSADTTQRQTTMERQLIQAHALLQMVLEDDGASSPRQEAPLSRHKMREVFCV